MTARLRVREWVVGYSGHPVAGPFDGDWEGGGVHLIRGENGSGKSTLARTIAGLLAPCGGRVLECTPGPARFVPQDFGSPALAALRTDQVVAMGSWQRSAGRRAPGHRSEGVRRVLDEVGLASRAAVPFGHLSGGQARRALIARALVGDPTFLVLDEPTAGLDTVAIERLAAVVEDAARDPRRIVWVVTHGEDWITGPVRSTTEVRAGGIAVDAGRGAPS